MTAHLAPGDYILRVDDPSHHDLLYEHALRTMEADGEYACTLIDLLRRAGFDDHAYRRRIDLPRDAVLSERDQAQRRLRALFDIAFRPVGPYTSADNTLGQLQAHLELARLAGHIPNKPDSIRDRGNH